MKAYDLKKAKTGGFSQREWVDKIKYKIQCERIVVLVLRGASYRLFQVSCQNIVEIESKNRYNRHIKTEGLKQEEKIYDFCCYDA